MTDLYDTLDRRRRPGRPDRRRSTSPGSERKVLVIDRVSGPLFFTLEKLCNVPGMPEATRHRDPEAAARPRPRELGAEIAARQRGPGRGTGGRLPAHRRQGGRRGAGAPCCSPPASPATTRRWTATSPPASPTPARATSSTAPTARGRSSSARTRSSSAPARPRLGGRHGRRPLPLHGAAAHPRHRRAGALRATAPRGCARTDIPVIAGEIKRADRRGKRHLTGLELQDGTGLTAEAFFVSSPARGRTDLAEQLGVEMRRDRRARRSRNPSAATPTSPASGSPATCAR